jgi:hypothetical protein
MSAFICGDDHFIALAVFAASRSRGRDWRVDPRYVEGLTHPEAKLRGLENFNPHELATLYADTLFQENIRSVRARYPDDKRDELPGPCILPLHIVVKPAHFQHRKWVLEPVDILKMSDCLEYQSCETEDYRTTIAYRLLNAIRRGAWQSLPGYEGAPWDYDASEARRVA